MNRFVYLEYKKIDATLISDFVFKQVIFCSTSLPTCKMEIKKY